MLSSKGKNFFLLLPKIAKKIQHRLMNLAKNTWFSIKNRRIYAPLFKTLKKDKRLSDNGSLYIANQIAKIFKIKNKTPAAAFCEIATFLVNSGYPDIAETYHELSLLSECSHKTYSLYLQGLLLNPVCTEEKMYQAAIKYDKLFLKNLKRYETYDNDLNKNRKLNIGYICHFFHNCVAKSSLLPFLKAHHADRVKVICYSDAEPALVPEFIKKIPALWRDTKHLDDDALASLIREDKIDILIELNGHIIVNRYLTLGRKPAPIQINYYNNAATTGISTIDYLIVGEDMAIHQDREYYTESIFQFKGVSCAIKFADDFPAASLSPPCLKNKYITFGSFGGAQKINQDVIKLWSLVLKRIPDARFYMKASVLSFEPYVKSYERLFASSGIDLNRIHFEGFSEHHEMLKCYADVDIALDTYPHCGGTTTMEATWQGVPVLSLYGERQSMQHGKAILESVGHPELVAYSKEEFVEKAYLLASDHDRLIKYRHELREDFRRSPKADIETFVNHLEDAFYIMWARYCESIPKACHF